VVFYDGVCAMCDALVQFLVARDTHERLHFAPIQGLTAKGALPRHGFDPESLNTAFFLTEWGTEREAIATRARAVLGMITALGGIWSLAHVLRVIPTFVLDFCYDQVAKRRYRIFGKKDACTIPTPRMRARLLD
jgi:predicted DCC family thiol-disulfide oxidoreductase YuxK